MELTGRIPTANISYAMPQPGAANVEREEGTVSVPPTHWGT